MFTINKVIEKLMDNCRQNFNLDISNNQNPFSTDDDNKSQKPIKGSKDVNSISVAVNTETLLEETLNLSEAVASSPPNLVKANKANPSKVNPFITVRPRKGDDFSKTPNQVKILTKIKAKIRDSMIKNLRGWEMSKKLKNANLYVWHCAGAKVRFMEDHIRPTLREKLNHIVLHVGTNDLVSDRQPNLIAKSIVDVASSIKNTMMSLFLTS